jgi:hypothetical protein
MFLLKGLLLIIIAAIVALTIQFVKHDIDTLPAADRRKAALASLITFVLGIFAWVTVLFRV